MTTLSERLGLADAYDLATVLSEEPLPYTAKRVEADRRATVERLTVWLDEVGCPRVAGIIRHALLSPVPEEGGGDG